MSVTVSCPACRSYRAQLAFDGYYACEECRTYLPRESFIRWLKTVDDGLVRRRAEVADLLKRVMFTDRNTDDTATQGDAPPTA